MEAGNTTTSRNRRQNKTTLVLGILTCIVAIYVLSQFLYRYNLPDPVTDKIGNQKTASFEIIDRLSDAPDYLVIPVGNAGNITAYWKGYKEFYDLGKISSKPKMMGFEAEGAAAIVKGQRIKC